MTTIQAQIFANHALVPRSDFERLLEIARRSENVDLHLREEELPTADIMRLAQEGGSFDFWREAGEDIYSMADGEPIE